MTKLIHSFAATILITILSFIPLENLTAQDSLPIEGKGMYLWQIWTTSGGGKNIDGIVNKLKSIGATWLIIKMGDGDSYYYRPTKLLYNWATTYYGNMDSVVSIFHANGIKLLAFQYVYGVPHYWGNTVSETDVANSILDINFKYFQ